MYNNLLISLISLIFKSFLSIGVFFILAHILPVDEYGAVSLAYTLAIIFSAISEYGYNFLILKEINANRIENVIWKILFQKLLLSLFVSMIVIAYCYLMFYETKNFYTILLIALSGIFFSFATFGSAAIKAKNIFIDESLIYGLQLGVLFSLMVVLYVSERLSAETFALALLFSRICSAIFSLWRLYIRFEFSMKMLDTLAIEQKKIFKDGSMYGLHVIFAIAYFQIDSQIIAYYGGEEFIGLYQNTLRFIVIGVMISEILQQVILPSLAKSYMNNTEQYSKLIKLSINIQASIMIPYVVILTVFDSEIVAFLYGENYLSVSKYVWAIILVAFMRSLGLVYGVSLGLSDRPILRILSVLSVLLISVALNFSLIPIYGYEVGFYVQVLVHIILNSIYIYYNYKFIGSTNFGTLALFSSVIIVFLSYSSFIGNTQPKFLLLLVPVFLSISIYYFKLFRREVLVYDN